MLLNEQASIYAVVWAWLCDGYIARGLESGMNSDVLCNTKRQIQHFPLLLRGRGVLFIKIYNRLKTLCKPTNTYSYKFMMNKMNKSHLQQVVSKLNKQNLHTPIIIMKSKTEYYVACVTEASSWSLQLFIWLLSKFPPTILANLRRSLFDKKLK